MLGYAASRLGMSFRRAAGRSARPARRRRCGSRRGRDARGSSRRIRAVAEVETAAYRDRAEALTVGVQTVAAAAAAEMSSEFMDEAMADLRTIPHPTTEQKAAALTRMLEVWRGRLGVIRDAEARTRMAAAIEAAEGAAQRRDLAATMQAVHGLRAALAGLPAAPRRRCQRGGGRALCRDSRDRSLQRLVETANHVKLQSGRPELADWDADWTAPDAACWRSCLRRSRPPTRASAQLSTTVGGYRGLTRGIHTRARRHADPAADAPGRCPDLWRGRRDRARPASDGRASRPEAPPQRPEQDRMAGSRSFSRSPALTPIGAAA